MDSKKQSFPRDSAFLQDEEFIKWRLFQTKDSEEYWSDFRAKNPHLERMVQDAIVQFNAVKINTYSLSDDDKKDIYRAILHNIHQYKKRRRLLKLSSIAAISLILVVSVLFITHIKDNSRTGFLQKETLIVGETLPEEEIYLISGDSKISITHKSHIGLTEDGKALVTDSTASRKELLLAKTELNKLVVPYGKRTNLTLSDGTEVWLNSGTQLDFPTEFTGNTREITVNGEIFIEVAHNPRIPFIVRTQNMDIHVYGTSFNVSAYKDDSRKTVVLVDGKVKIETGNNRTSELLPNEKIEVTENNITKETVNVSEYTSWTRGVLEFNGTPMSEILKKIGRYYNVQFEGTQNVKLHDQTCTGKLFLSNNLDSVMTSVSILSSTVYSRDNNIIHISKK